jgi:hypothetical protein
MESPVHRGEPERTTVGKPLFWFYASCALVSLGAAIAAVSFLTFGDRDGTSGPGIAGVAMVALGILGAFVSLTRARRG